MDRLDRPVWASLSTHHATLSEGGLLARRFIPDVSPFAAAGDDSEAGLAALAALLRPGESAYVVQAPAIAAPPGLTVTKRAKVVQMLATRSLAPQGTAADIAVLTEADAPEMLALATLTEPGPFLARTPIMGQFRGIRIDGRLAAMAGERFRFPGFTEVSAVCTHPDFRGRGLARRLSAVGAAAIEARGEIPFLHAWTTNAVAIALYESMGFRVRCEINVAVIARPAA